MEDIINVDGSEMFKILWFITALAFMIERALAVVFEHRVWLALREEFHLKGAKEIIAILVAFALCFWANFDAIALMFGKQPGTPGLVLTALIIAGGSKGAVKLMQEVLGIKRPLTASGKPIAK